MDQNIENLYEIVLMFLSFCLTYSDPLTFCTSKLLSLLLDNRSTKVIYLIDIDEFVAYVGNFAIRQISLDTNDMLDVVLPLERVMDVFAFDWDPVEDQMYWADNDEDQITIRRGKIKPIHQEVCFVKIAKRFLSLLEQR